LKKSIYQMIGLAQKARMVSSGTMAAKSSIIGRRAELLILSGDISTRAKEELVRACRKREIPYLVIGDKYKLGAHVGKAYRVALTVNDKGLAQAIINSVEELTEEERRQMGVVEWQK